MSENKEEKKGFWSTLFAPKKKSSCCCGSQIEIVPENTDKEETPACSCATDNSGNKVIKVLGNRLLKLQGALQHSTGCGGSTWY